MKSSETSAKPHYRGRFAPSPTGSLHFGSLIAATASYADARAHRGEWLLRIEDLDPPREIPGSTDEILRTLEAYGFAWDGVVERQSLRSDLYRTVFEKLQKHGLLFPCTCSRNELAQAPLNAYGERIYPGTCRSKPPHPHRAPAWRIKVPDQTVQFTDLLQGMQSQNLALEVGDFVVLRADGYFAYQLAVVADDAAQEVTHIVRGADLLASTTRQIWLQRCLDYPSPHYLHIPIAVDSSGAKFSKQTRAAPLPKDSVLPTLYAAWRFLDQAAPPREFSKPSEFWLWAEQHWQPTRLPPLNMLPVAGQALSGTISPHRQPHENG